MFRGRLLPIFASFALVASLAACGTDATAPDLAEGQGFNNAVAPTEGQGFNNSVAPAETGSTAVIVEPCTEGQGFNNRC